MWKKKICPECKNSMCEEVKNWVTIDKCKNCGGIFLDFWEMKDFIENTKQEKDFKTIQKWNLKKKKVKKEKILCANCDWEVMEEREFIYWSWYYIDFCRSCWAIYLNKWELEQIINYEINRTKSEQWKKMLKKLERESKSINKNQKNTLNKIWKPKSFIYRIFDKFFD